MWSRKHNFIEIDFPWHGKDPIADIVYLTSVMYLSDRINNFRMNTNIHNTKLHNWPLYWPNYIEHRNQKKKIEESIDSQKAGWYDKMEYDN